VRRPFRVRAIWLQIVTTVGARTVALAASAVSLLLAARVLGPDQHGQLAAAINWAGLLATFGNLSLGQVALHLVGGRPRDAWLPGMLGTLLAFTALLSILLAMVGAVLASLGSAGPFGTLPPALIVIAAGLLPSLVWEAYAVPLATAANRLDAYNLFQSLSRATILLLLAVGLALGGRTLWTLCAIVAGNAVVAGGSIRDLVRASSRPPRVEPRLARDLLRGALRLHLNAVGTFFLLPIGVLVVHSLRGAAETGYYQVALQLFSALVMVPTAAAIVLYGRVARDGPDGAWGWHRRVLVGLTLAMLAAGAVAWIAAPLALPLVAGAAYGPAVEPFRVMLLGLAGITITSVMAPQWIGRGWFWQASAVTVTAAVLNVGLTLSLVPRLGPSGAAWSLVVAYLFMGAINVGLAIRCERRPRRGPSSAQPDAAV
jgi:O-antigen/teichoic acid export membrane protein